MLNLEVGKTYRIRRNWKKEYETVIIIGKEEHCERSHCYWAKDLSYKLWDRGICKNERMKNNKSFWAGNAIVECEEV